MCLTGSNYPSVNLKIWKHIWKHIQQNNLNTYLNTYLEHIPYVFKVCVQRYFSRGWWRIWYVFKCLQANTLSWYDIIICFQNNMLSGMCSRWYVIMYVIRKKNMYSKYVFRVYVFNIYIQNITICYHNKTICVQICVHCYMYSIYVFTIPRYTFRVYVISICFEKSKYVLPYVFDICFHSMLSVYVMKLCIPKNM